MNNEYEWTKNIDWTIEYAKNFDKVCEILGIYPDRELIINDEYSGGVLYLDKFCSYHDIGIRIKGNEKIQAVDMYDSLSEDEKKYVPAMLLLDKDVLIDVLLRSHKKYIDRCNKIEKDYEDLRKSFEEYKNKVEKGD